MIPAKLFRVIGTVAAVALTGAVADRVVSPLGAQALSLKRHRHEPADDAARPDTVAAVLGGYRGLAANLLWLRLHARWERRDLRGVDALVRTVPRLRPESAYFWRNGARMIAYDFPAWRIAAAGGYSAVSAKRRQHIEEEQARAALEYLEEALQYHPESAELWIERAHIAFARLQDFAQAADNYRRAAETTHAPKYAARLHAEMLRRVGRNAEALAWLMKLHPTLRPESDEDASELVLARIRELERELHIGPEQAYQPAPRAQG